MSVIQDVKDGILYITISRESVWNALNRDVFTSLREIFESIPSRAEVKGIILTGAGQKAFVAGADISEFKSINEKDAFELSRRGQAVFDLIEQCPKPVIAAINGFALGGGCELAMSCHIRVATINSKFGQPEVNLGLIPGYGGTQRLAQLIGRGRALELLLSADMINAEEALRIGLVNHVYAGQEQMMGAATALMQKILSKSPVAISHIIAAVNVGFRSQAEGLEQEARAFASCTRSDDFKEGVSAFLEKRKPTFKGN